MNLKKGDIVSVWFDSEVSIMGEFNQIVTLGEATFLELSFPVEFRTKTVVMQPQINLPQGSPPLEPVRIVHTGSTVPVVNSLLIPVGKYSMGIIDPTSKDAENYRSAVKMITGEDSVSDLE